jgi:hypothetical protein
MDPAATEEPILIVRSLVTPADDGVTGLTVNEPQVTPAGRVELTHDRVTGTADPAVRVALIVTAPELPACIVTGPLLVRE